VCFFTFNGTGRSSIHSFLSWKPSCQYSLVSVGTVCDHSFATPDFFRLPVWNHFERFIFDSYNAVPREYHTSRDLKVKTSINYLQTHDLINMLVKTALVALVGLAVAAEAASIHHTPTMNRLSRRQNKNGGKNNGNAGNAASAGNANAGSATCLAANALQTGSESTGQVNGVAADGQVNSLTCVLHLYRTANYDY
jgi:hypothetical protein